MLRMFGYPTIWGPFRDCSRLTVYFYYRLGCWNLFTPGARGRRGCRSGTILTILYLCTEYLRTGSGEFPLWRRCGRFHYGEPYFWNIYIYWSMYVYCVYGYSYGVYIIETVEEDCLMLYLRAEIQRNCPGTDRLIDIVIGPSPHVFVCMYGIWVWGITIRYYDM